MCGLVCKHVRFCLELYIEEGRTVVRNHNLSIAVYFRSFAGSRWKGRLNLKDQQNSTGVITIVSH